MSGNEESMPASAGPNKASEANVIALFYIRSIEMAPIWHCTPPLGEHTAFIMI